MKTVTIYSTPSCHYCHMAKEFFNANNIQFTDYNVAEDSAKREEMVEMTGQMGVPVIVVEKDDDSELVLLGFDKDKMATELGIEL